MTESIIGIARAYSTGNPGSTVVVIPKDAHKRMPKVKGQKFLVKLDEKGRLIYEPLTEGPR